MPELPEIHVIAKQMSEEIRGKRIAEIEVRQPKNLNKPMAEFIKATEGKLIETISCRGKWLFLELNPAYFMLINLGMGGELLYFSSTDKLPEKYHFKLTFVDKTGFTAHFWWFGYIHLVEENNLSKHKMTVQLGKSATDETFTLEYFKKLLAQRKSAIKSFLLDQKNVAGIGNVYVQDILFKAKLHPNRKISTLSETEIVALYNAIKKVLYHSIELCGLAYEKDFYGQRGRFTAEQFLVGYKQGKPCPECGTTIEKIKTGTTSSYICPNCQTLK